MDRATHCAKECTVQDGTFVQDLNGQRVWPHVDPTTLTIVAAITLAFRLPAQGVSALRISRRRPRLPAVLAAARGWVVQLAHAVGRRRRTLAVGAGQAVAAVA